MTDSTSPAVDAALAYHQAWTSHDVDKAMSCVADDIVCQSPDGPIEGAAGFCGFISPFAQIVTEHECFGVCGCGLVGAPEATQEVGPGCSEVAAAGEVGVVAELVKGFRPGVRAVGEADRDGPGQGYDRGRPVLDEQVAGRVASEVPT